MVVLGQGKDLLEKIVVHLNVALINANDVIVPELNSRDIVCSATHNHLDLFLSDPPPLGKEIDPVDAANPQPVLLNINTVLTIANNLP